MSPTTPSENQGLLVAESMLGHRPDRLEAFHPTFGGDDSHAFRLWVGTDQMLLKIKRRPGSPVGIYFHRRLREAGLPVPEMVAFAPNAGPNGQACVIWDWIEGRPTEWGAGEPCPYDEAELGQLLRRVHDLRFDGPFCFLGDDPPSPSSFSYLDIGPVTDSWAEFFHFDRAARRLFDKGYLSRSEADALASSPQRLREELDRAEPRLLHMGDVMHHGNLLVDQRGRIVAILDYVESMAGDPRWELAWFDYYFAALPFASASFDMARFRAGYQANHDADDRLGRFYLLAILTFDKLRWFDPSSQKGRWAIETTKGILSALARTTPRGDQ